MGDPGSSSSSYRHFHHHYRVISIIIKKAECRHGLFQPTSSAAIIIATIALVSTICLYHTIAFLIITFCVVFGILARTVAVKAIDTDDINSITKAIIITARIAKVSITTLVKVSITTFVNAMHTHCGDQPSQHHRHQQQHHYHHHD